MSRLVSAFSETFPTRPRYANLNTHFTFEEMDVINQAVRLCEARGFMSGVTFVHDYHVNKTDEASIMLAKCAGLSNALFYIIKDVKRDKPIEYTLNMREPGSNGKSVKRVDTVNFTEISKALIGYYRPLALEKSHLRLV